MRDISRRDFVKTAGAAGLFMIAQGKTLRTYAENTKVQIACIGTGGQGSFHQRTGLAGTDALQIIGVADVFERHQRHGVLYGQISNAKVPMKEGETYAKLSDATKQKIDAATRPAGYYDYKEMLADLGNELDAVVISTPLDTHFEIAMNCLTANKWVFCEKTMVRTIEEGRALVEKCHENGKFLQIGHQRRYNPKYNFAMDLVYGDKSAFGRITHITAQWHRNENWRRDWKEEYGDDYQLNDEEKKYIPDLEQHLNWRMYSKHSGGLFTELATHQTDVANWFLRTMPKRVYAMGGLDYWRDGREVDDNIAIAYEYEQKRGKPGFKQIDSRSPLQDVDQCNKTYTVRFLYSSILENQKRGASEMIQADYGTLELSETDCTMYLEPVRVEGPKKKDDGKDKGKAKGKMPAKKKDDGESTFLVGGTLLTPEQMRALIKGEKLLTTCNLQPADVYQFEAFAHHIQNGGKPRTNEMVGLTTAIGAIAAIQSREQNKPIDIDPAWYAFDFETPSFTDYAFDHTEYNCKERYKPASKKAQATKKA